MTTFKQPGRWVILLDEGIPPTFWSADRETLDVICSQLRPTCHTARVVWQPAVSSQADTGGKAWGKRNGPIL